MVRIIYNAAKNKTPQAAATWRAMGRSRFQRKGPQEHLHKASERSRV